MIKNTNTVSFSPSQKSRHPWCSDSNESACNLRDLGPVPELRRSPGKGNGQPLQYSSLESSRDRGAWRDTIRGVAESPRRRSNKPFTLRKASLTLQCLSMERGRNGVRSFSWLIFCPWYQSCAHFTSTSPDLGSHCVASNLPDTVGTKGQVSAFGSEVLFRGRQANS